MTPIKNPTGLDGGTGLGFSQFIGETMTDFTFRGWLKSRIITLALLSLITIKLADWLIQRGGLSHD